MSDAARRLFRFERLEAEKRLKGVRRVILVGSGKGGVGKSFVACSIAVLLAEEGHRTGILDIDIHGASVQNYLNVKPPLRSTERGLEPKQSHGVMVMSVALLVGDNPVPMRGEEKQDLITQLMALTDWGRLDYLVVDLPPGTGDELLSAFDLFADKSRLILVTTPSQNAIGVVARLRRLAETERVPVEGIVLNMAYQKGRGSRKSFPFGRADWSLERTLASKILAELPLEPRLSSEGLDAILEERSGTSLLLRELAGRLSGGERELPS